MQGIERAGRPAGPGRSPLSGGPGNGGGGSPGLSGGGKRSGGRPGDSLSEAQSGGRATFLPLNKIRAPKFNPIQAWQRPDGFFDYAVNLIDCDPRYEKSLPTPSAAPWCSKPWNWPGSIWASIRIVTLDGEILESSGAMTGGNLSKRQGSLHFGTVEPAESEEAQALKQRLERNRVHAGTVRSPPSGSSADLQTLSQTLITRRQQYREMQLQSQQQQAEQQNLPSSDPRPKPSSSQYQQELATTQAACRNWRHPAHPRSRN
jgi:chromosome segregation protein